MHKEFEIDVLRRGGKYIVFEEGGGCTSSGTAYIICGKNGERLMPTSVVKDGCGRSNEKHASFVLTNDIHIVRASFAHGEMSIAIAYVKEIKDNHWAEYYHDVATHTATCRIIMSSVHGVWDIEQPESFDEAIRAAKDKCLDYHCRSAYYYLTKKKELS